MNQNNKQTLTLASGFTFDYTNLYGDDKVTEKDIAAIESRLTAAHRAIEHMRATGEVRGHLSKDGLPEKVLFTQLPYVREGNLNSPSSLERLQAFSRSIRNNIDAVISFGIGGSFLGNKVLFDVHCGEFWNSKTAEARNGYPKLYFSGNNMDPRRTTELIGHIETEARIKTLHSPNTAYKVMLVVISKSGSTLDTMSTFMVAYDKLKKIGPHIIVEVVAVTDPAAGSGETLLHKLAAGQGWPMFSVPDGVGGRFSVFSEVGLITAACIGLDIEKFLAGARAMDEACLTDNIRHNPAMLNAALKYLAAEKYGRDIEVFMPYADYLKSLAEWYIQLLAESLGKRTDRSGREVFYGRTPIAAVGTTDMHAQTQQHQDGKKDKVVQFIKVAEWDDDPVIPNVFPGAAKLAEISSIRLSQALDAAREANAAALTSDQRFNATIVLPRLNAYHLGELLYLLALSVAYEGELADVDAFDQPGVETYKRILGPRLKELKIQ
ncbi:MAG TPA: glucose-6-phosphate isomerase [Methylomusa anaerophila]|uniref:Glucose-6-phosphate isomerase n=1 Tax=Methylomusa anaerophila TaxID=1930071 RepID=A0A348AKS5_9FIRM|nr:glucose-6-phosphate isomerase [Methylomusa anaerophila]BBB91673.1 glucose-6-phosphate isomerase [Methylomusa anaerophila]HML88593.1 glucose-6-phosphate isomerase [Methylomusa anaerophila]